MKMKKILTALAISALTGGGALAADKILKGDQLVVPGVRFPQAFKTPSGQVLKAGIYDLKLVSDGTIGILIGLLKGGKQVGQLKGTVMQGGNPFCGACDDQPQKSGGPARALPVDQGVKLQPAGGALPVDQGVKIQPAGGALPVDQGVKLQPGVAAGPVRPPGDPKSFRQLGFAPASPVSFGGGGGKISCSNNLQPGALLPYIEFLLLPAVHK